LKRFFRNRSILRWGRLQTVKRLTQLFPHGRTLPVRTFDCSAETFVDTRNDDPTHHKPGGVRRDGTTRANVAQRLATHLIARGPVGETIPSPPFLHPEWFRLKPHEFPVMVAELSDSIVKRMHGHKEGAKYVNGSTRLGE